MTEFRMNQLGNNEGRKIMTNTKQDLNKNNVTEHSLPIVEHEGKYYFKDEAEVGNYNHPIYF